MNTDHLKALSIVKAISSFVLEHEESLTAPNTVHMTKTQRDLVSRSFPYLISGEFYVERNHRLKIILNEERTTSVGVGFAYFTELIDEYKEGSN